MTVDRRRLLAGVPAAVVGSALFASAATAYLRTSRREVAMKPLSLTYSSRSAVDGASFVLFHAGTTAARMAAAAASAAYLRASSQGKVSGLTDPTLTTAACRTASMIATDSTAPNTAPTPFFFFNDTATTEKTFDLVAPRACTRAISRLRRMPTSSS